MTKKHHAIRIGRIDFTNVWPLFYYFPFSSFGSELEVIQQVPSQLNRAMANGEIDIGPISSFAYGENFENYMLFPHMSVSAFSHVKSILLFHRKPLEELGKAKIALPTTSATSVHLLKIIMTKFYRLEPDYVYAAPDLEPMMKSADAALLIGDHAIRASWEDNGYLVTDLAEEWTRQTGQWMSFAVCAIRKQTVEQQPDQVQRIYEAFLESKRQSLADLTGLVVDAQALIGGTESYWQHYFSTLSYEFGPKQQAGLKLYYQYAAELGFLDREVALHIWKDNSVVRVTE
ncbi:MULTISPECIES: menaquinone biosynthesis protein [unclassified Paenibacillus]|uniref:menaquinone biosynthetic enzyme MqnA/MqnD family protein n=1 Tax=unclassified Paenibacillus TaxID=185978 RepID=UPI001AE8C292|nr:MULTISPECIES: menaquinone biosynthesis protein [unclassified Paenibacillus]MBP1155262.1 chorismate dehydratase [Paenibacillus sp. PvP091]MBP1169354.1 chorismate dehydratase [Paenibacillus sp. PvR098]MBP2440382.1 chorismate dehydratase [Paenibacillus sp. PvP052]